jgi:hypothetical protein
MHKISNKHGFWTKSMADVINQAVTENETDKIVKKLMSAAVPSKSCNPTRAATKGIKNMTSASSGSFIDTSLIGTSFKAEQAIVKKNSIITRPQFASKLWTMMTSLKLEIPFTLLSK